MTRDVDLLQREMGLLWGTDTGRGEPSPLVAWAVATDGCAVRVSPRVPRALAVRLHAEGGSSTGRGDPSHRPPELDRWAAELVAPSGPATVRGGPSFLVRSTPVVDSPARVCTSAQPVPAVLSAARPWAWWEPQEWEDLLSGRLGPWAIAMDGARVVAVCHTSRDGHGAAEAGVWTHPDARRRGHAAAVTAAWARVAAEGHDALFSSTSEHNSASRGVARRLGLRPVGWIWQLHPTTGPSDAGVPLGAPGDS